MRFWVNILSFCFLAAIIGIVAVFIGIAKVSDDLPDSSSLLAYDPPILTRLHAGDGRFMAEYAAEKRLFVPLAAMPPLVTNAFLSAEDKDYYKHEGVNFLAIARAMVTNLKQIGSGRRPIGASTITQQVARNFFLTNEVSYMRKVKEILLAFRIERTLAKDKILELYLNQIFLGQRSYGVAAAALTYFNKSLNELTVAQAAYLAALPKGPNNYNPATHKEAAVGRRNWVLGRMLEDAHITKAEYDTAVAEDLVATDRMAAGVADTDYFAEEVRRELVGRFGEEAVLQGGLYVRTTVDPDLQTAATRALRNGLEDYDQRRFGWRGPVGHVENFKDWPMPLAAIQRPAGSEGWELAAITEVGAGVDIVTADRRGNLRRDQIKWTEDKNGKLKLKKGDVILVSYSGKEELFELHQVPTVQGALVALDVHTGRVLAMVGGFSAKMSVFNRATQAQRQPGSSFKPFVYLAALDNGFTPSSLVMDAPFAYPQGPGLPLWKPENYSNEFYGPTPLRVGIEKSRNVMTVRLAHAVTMETIAAYAKKFGLADEMPLYLSMALGSIEVTPLQLTTAYAMIVNGGRKIVPGFIDVVEDKRGAVIWQHDQRRCSQCMNLKWDAEAGAVMAAPSLPDIREQVQDPRTAYQMTSILEGVVQRGTAAKLKSVLNFPVAGKTGTTNDSKDAWFVGFTPDIAAGVYVGFDEPQTLGGHETGASLAAPIFGEFMQAAMKDKPGIPFRVPANGELVMARVNAKTGAAAAVGDPDTIWEAFLPGTDPASQPQGLLDGTIDETTGEMVPSVQVAPEGGEVMIAPEFGGDGVVNPVPAVPAGPPPSVSDGLY